MQLNIFPSNWNKTLGHREFKFERVLKAETFLSNSPRTIYKQMNYVFHQAYK
ncbi:hypothetical protein THF1C08_320104 [Vibrio jasicida]|uniref:Transposase n=1 Tax=Vibrio jasicida TaxID=766224 RepID=A0AAU9QRM6_9VIBR|nr:hypothetical protein THF1C08_320104 [Vibrio jasicida]CAH1597573.1 hypothetical protein THF1A12_320104 [Vibrio jasicida]